jgi:hypothetical protein
MAKPYGICRIFIVAPNLGFPHFYRNHLSNKDFVKKSQIRCELLTENNSHEWENISNVKEHSHVNIPPNSIRTLTGYGFFLSLDPSIHALTPT